MGVYVQVLRQTQVVERGRTRTVYPGDSVEVGRTVALEWAAAGIARPWRALTLTAEDTAGVVMVTPTEALAERLHALAPDVRIIVQALDMDVILTDADTRLVWWDGTRKLSGAMLESGLRTLTVWEAACPMADYRLLACDIGTSFEQEATRSLIGDMRVPLYDPGLLFCRLPDPALALVTEWGKAKYYDPGDARLAFLRALWIVKPKLLPLPPAWGGQ